MIVVFSKAVNCSLEPFANGNHTASRARLHLPRKESGGSLLFFWSPQSGEMYFRFLLPRPGPNSRRSALQQLLVHSTQFFVLTTNMPVRCIWSACVFQLTRHGKFLRQKSHEKIKNIAFQVTAGRAHHWSSALRCRMIIFLGFGSWKIVLVTI